jgi:6-phosphogluconate dehydrogenase (decarboxylating)
MTETEETSNMGLLAAAAAATAANKNNIPATTTLANKNKSAGRLNDAEESIWRMIEAAYSGIDSIVISAENGQVSIGGGNSKCKSQLTVLSSIAGTPIGQITNKVLKKFFPLAKSKNYKDKSCLHQRQGYGNDHHICP